MKQNLKDMVILSLLGPLLFVLGDLAFEMLPNIHLVGVLVVVITAVYRGKALVPIYIYVFLSGLYGGFSLWWIPYLYVWAILWGAVMLLPRRNGAYIAACAAHGFLFGVLYAPAQAVMFHFGWKQTLAWVVAGLPFDAVHGVSNLLLGLVLIPPLVKLLGRLQQSKML